MSFHSGRMQRRKQQANKADRFMAMDARHARGTNQPTNQPLSSIQPDRTTGSELFQVLLELWKNFRVALGPFQPLASANQPTAVGVNQE